MSTYVLVHGAWHTGAELEPVMPRNLVARIAGVWLPLLASYHFHAAAAAEAGASPPPNSVLALHADHADRGPRAQKLGDCAVGGASACSTPASAAVR